MSNALFTQTIQRLVLLYPIAGHGQNKVCKELYEGDMKGNEAEAAAVCLGVSEKIMKATGRRAGEPAGKW